MRCARSLLLWAALSVGLLSSLARPATAVSAQGEVWGVPYSTAGDEDVFIPLGDAFSAAGEGDIFLELNSDGLASSPSASARAFASEDGLGAAADALLDADAPPLPGSAAFLSLEEALTLSSQLTTEAAAAAATTAAAAAAAEAEAQVDKASAELYTEARRKGVPTPPADKGFWKNVPSLSGVYSRLSAPLSHAMGRILERINTAIAGPRYLGCSALTEIQMLAATDAVQYKLSCRAKVDGIPERSLSVHFRDRFGVVDLIDFLDFGETTPFVSGAAPSTPTNRADAAAAAATEGADPAGAAGQPLVVGPAKGTEFDQYNDPWYLPKVHFSEGKESHGV